MVTVVARRILCMSSNGMCMYISYPTGVMVKMIQQSRYMYFREYNHVKVKTSLIGTFSHWKTYIRIRKDNETHP